LLLINHNTKKVLLVDFNELNVSTSNIQALYFDGINLWIGTSEGLVRLKVGNELAHIKK
jgi:ligand-binding sensor domain-containing protein